MRDRTKRVLADELEQMLHEMSLEKIRVKDLCERCGERRQLFYYHFQDKYALIAWIYDQEYSYVADREAVKDYQDLVCKVLERFWARRDFYRRAFADKSQNSIEWHIHQENIRATQDLLRQHAGVKKMTNAQLHDVMFHSFGSVSTVVEWLCGNLVATPAELASWHCAHMPAYLRKVHEEDVRSRSVMRSTRETSRTR